MNYEAAVERIYTHAENGDIDKALLACLRVARHQSDYFSIAVFLNELYSENRDKHRIFFEDTRTLKDEERTFIWKKALKFWADSRVVDIGLGKDEFGEDLNVHTMAAGTLDADIQQHERAINDMAIPVGMSEYDTAAFTDRYNTKKSYLRTLIIANQTIKDRIRSRCVNYAITVEKQLEAQRQAKSFLEQVQTEVNNYFKARSEDVHVKLQTAAELMESNSPEKYSLILTQIRRAIKSAADFFYPASDKEVLCSDGVKRVLGDDKYMNRLQEFLLAKIPNSSSQELLTSELNYLAVFCRRLDKIASKGVHATVTMTEGKQDLLGIYLFLFNLCSYLEKQDVDGDVE